MSRFKEYMESNNVRSLDVYVPQDLTIGIRQGSGIVGAVVGDRTTIDFEGNLYGAQNVVTFCDRVMIAAGRHIERYPTIARTYVQPEAVIRVGTYDGDEVTLDHPRCRELVAAWIGVDEAQLDAELHPSEPCRDCGQPWPHHPKCIHRRRSGDYHTSTVEGAAAYEQLHGRL